MDELLVGLDVGTSNIRCVIAVINEENKPMIVSTGACKSEGIRNGVVVNIKAAMASVSQAIEIAEARGYEVSGVVAGISGPSIEGLNSRGVVAVGAGREITPSDMERVMEAARAVVLPMDREILHVIPQEYIVDEVRQIKNPLGMTGVRLEAEAHIVTVGMASVRNLIHGLNSAGLVVQEILMGSLASSEAVLTEDEKNYGCLFFDMGAGTTEVILFSGGSPRFSKIFPFGSDHVTRDLAQVLGVSELEAERIKMEEGSCVPGIQPDDAILIQPIGSQNVQKVSRKDVISIISARVAEIFDIVKKDIQKNGLLERMNGGVVLTGGGAKLTGIMELCSLSFGRNTRIGVPMHLENIKEGWSGSEWSAACGLVLSSFNNPDNAKPTGNARVKKSGGFISWMEKIFKKII